MQSNLPSAYDTILVEFQMPNDDVIWWPTLVEEITLPPAGSPFLAIATVRYDDGHDNNNNYYHAERGSVRFISPHTLESTSEGKTFCKGLLLHWKYESTQAIADADNEYTPIATAAVAPSTDTQSTTRRDIDCLFRMYDSLLKDMRSLQRLVATAREDEVHEQRAAQLAETKKYLFNEFLGLLRRPPTQKCGDASAPFSATLRRHCLEYTLPCSLAHFAIITEDIDKRFTEKQVTMLPSRAIALNPTTTFQDFDVVFHSSTDILQWMGIVHEQEASAYTLRIHQKKLTDGYARLLGGLQWSPSDPNQPLNIFPGHSCKQEVPTSTGERQLTSFKIPTAQWDDTNGMFRHKFYRACATPGLSDLSIRGIDLSDFDIFRLSWKPLQERRSPHHSSHSSQNINNGVVLGQLKMVIPSVIITSSSVYNSIHNMVQQI